MTQFTEEIWVEKYAPKSLDDMIISDELKLKFKNMLDTNTIPNMTLYSSTPGIGKTTIAKLLVEVLDREVLFLNGSKENGIDTLRTKMENFIMTSSLDGRKKVIIIDEADYLQKNSTQPALRGLIETHYNHCTFILTCNYKEKIIEPIISRCPIVNFNIMTEDKVILAKQLQARLYYILDKEGVEYKKKAITQILKDYFPDYRQIINIIQGIYNTQHHINEFKSVNLESVYDPLLTYFKEDNYKMIKDWTRNNYFNPNVFKELYEVFYPVAHTDLKIRLAIILSKFDARSQSGANAELSLLACLTDIFLDFK